MAYSEYKGSPLQRVLELGLGEIATLYHSYLGNKFATDYLNGFQELLKFLNQDFFPRFSKGGPDGLWDKAGLAKSALSLGAKALTYKRINKKLSSNENLKKLRYDIAKLISAMFNEMKGQEKEKFSGLAPFLDPKKLNLPDFVLDRIGRIFEDNDQKNYQKFIRDELDHQNSIIQCYEEAHPAQTSLTQSSSGANDSEEDADEQADLSANDSFEHSSIDTERASVDLPVNPIDVEKDNQEENAELTRSVLALKTKREEEARLDKEIVLLEQEIKEIKVAYNESDTIVNSVNQRLEKMAGYLAKAPGNDEEWLAFFNALEALIPDDSAKPKPHIPFKVLDASQLLTPKGGFKPGFDLLLKLFDTPEDQRTAWNIYRERQESFTKDAHPRQNYIDQRALLVSEIQSRKQAIATKKLATAKNQELKSSHLEKMELLTGKMDALENVRRSILSLEIEVSLVQAFLDTSVEFNASVASLLRAEAVGHKKAMDAAERRESQAAAEAIRAKSRSMLQERRAALAEILSSAKKELVEQFPELAVVNHLKAHHPEQYQFLVESTKVALSTYTFTKDPELALLAIINEKKLVVQSSKEELFLDSIYWKIQFRSAGIAYPKEYDKNPILTMKHRISRISPEYMTALNLIDERLMQMKKHGLKLQRQKEPCAEKMIFLERQLRMMLERFILQHGDGNTVSPEALRTFKKTFSEKLRAPYNDPFMSHHRAKWKQWIANVALALTSFVSYVIRTRHTTHKVGRAAEGHDTFFFHKTDRQHQIDSVEDAFNKLEDVKKPTK